ARHTPDQLAQEVAVALMTMSSYDPAALSGNYAGWTVPLDYNTVHELFRDLHLVHYSGQIHLGDFVREYRHWVALGIALFAAMVLIIAYVTNLNYRLKSSTSRLENEISERRRTETELTKLSSAVEHTADIVMITDPRGIIEYVNPAFEEVTGYSREEVVGKTSKIMKSGKHDKRFYDKLWRTIPAGEVYRDLFVNRRKDGSLFYEEKTITPLKDEHGNIGHLISTGKDVTERIVSEDLNRRHQEQLAHVSRVGMMGEMASSIAHELNQPLSAIANYARGCVLRLQSKDFNVSQIIVALENVISQSDRSAEIIRRMRNFVRKGDPKRVRVDVTKIVKDAAGLAYIEARKKGITLRLELGENVPDVNADVIQIEQVILNLIRNAIEAMANNRWNDRELVIFTRVNDAGQVEVAVRDTGHGLVGTGGDLMYNAFYTTKPGGMGMGLSISRSIVEAHGGSLSAVNNTGKGATFRFTLPSVDEDAASGDDADASVTEKHFRNAS
ncbi:MAG: PAS domain S-box protein, partial [Pseudomonadota bacterium]